MPRMETRLPKWLWKRNRSRACTRWQFLQSSGISRAFYSMRGCDRPTAETSFGGAEYVSPIVH